MSISISTSTGRSVSAKARKQDREAGARLLKRQKQRKAIEEASDFADTLAKICPEYFGGEK